MGLESDPLAMSAARYLTSDPTQSLSLTRDGRPYMDFAAAPSLFLEEDIRQENLLLVHRQKVCEDLKQSEINEAQAVAARTEAERFAEQKIHEERAAAARAAEAREIQARAAIARAQELREMLQSARAEQERASQERLQTAQLLRRLLLSLVALRQPLLRLAVPKTVHTPSASPSRLRHTELLQSTVLCPAVVATSWIKFQSPNLWCIQLSVA